MATTLPPQIAGYPKSRLRKQRSGERGDCRAACKKRRRRNVFPGNDLRIPRRPCAAPGAAALHLHGARLKRALAASRTVRRKRIWRHAKNEHTACHAVQCAAASGSSAQKGRTT
jgi:hypothetical protein